MSNPYADETFRWWHLSEPSPELREALAAGELGSAGRALDLGCGLGVEAAALARAGFRAAGVDLSQQALRRAARAHPTVAFVRADVRRLPFPSGSLDLLLDRGCFHYLDRADRPLYAAEAKRLLRSGGRLLLRACLNSAGVRNDIDEREMLRTFAGWRCLRLARQEIPSDTRTMPAIVALFEPSA